MGRIKLKLKLKIEMTPTFLKLILLAVILLEHLLGLIPLKIGLSHTNLLSCLNCFSAGIFLAMAITHLFPEAIELYSDYAKSADLKNPFPVPCLCFLVGYSIILTLELLTKTAKTNFSKVAKKEEEAIQIE